MYLLISIVIITILTIIVSIFIKSPSDEDMEQIIIIEKDTSEDAPTESEEIPYIAEFETESSEPSEPQVLGPD